MVPDADLQARRVVRAACPHDCPDTCAMLVTVEDGRAIAIRGAADHPPTQGVLCTKVARYLDRTYSPDRVLHPMRRVGPKGSGRFERISWDDAIGEIAARFRALADSSDGPQSILPYSYAGNMGLLNYASMDRRFFHRLGASLLDRTICASAGKAGWASVVGASIGMDIEQVVDAQADRDLGQQPGHVEPALLDARAGSQAPRREAWSRSIPTAARRPRSATSTSRPCPAPTRRSPSASCTC